MEFWDAQGVLLQFLDHRTTIKAHFCTVLLYLQEDIQMKETVNLNFFYAGTEQAAYCWDNFLIEKLSLIPGSVKHIY
jgi:hypothetical protein